MSEFQVKVVKIENIIDHDNADTLSIVDVEGYPCITRKNEFRLGDLAIYIPIDSVVKEDSMIGKTSLSFLKFKNGEHIVKAIRLRGVFSMGILIHIPENIASAKENDDLQDLLDIHKYEEPDPEERIGSTGNLKTRTPCVKDPGCMVYYDIENYRKYHKLFIINVVVTEKIHGINSRFGWFNEEFYVGSHGQFKKEDPASLWWKIANKYNLAEKLKPYNDRFALYGEIYGSNIQKGMNYGSPGELLFAAFDIWDMQRRRFLDYKHFKKMCEELEIPTVPVLYEGPYDDSVIRELAKGQSTIAGHIKEGVVIRPDRELYSDKLNGRLQLKLHNEEFLLKG